MARMPEVIKVGSLVYEVRVVPGSAREGGYHLLGEHDYLEQVLRIGEEVPEPIRPHILLHEVLHAALDFCGHSFEGEEAVVSGLAHVLVMILRDNPQLVDYLLWGEWEREEGQEVPEEQAA